MEESDSKSGREDSNLDRGTSDSAIEDLDSNSGRKDLNSGKDISISRMGNSNLGDGILD